MEDFIKKTKRESKTLLYLQSKHFAVYYAISICLFIMFNASFLVEKYSPYRTSQGDITFASVVQGVGYALILAVGVFYFSFNKHKFFQWALLGTEILISEFVVLDTTCNLIEDFKFKVIAIPLMVLAAVIPYSLFALKDILVRNQITLNK